MEGRLGRTTLLQMSFYIHMNLWTPEEKVKLVEAFVWGLETVFTVFVGVSAFLGKAFLFPLT